MIEKGATDARLSGSIVTLGIVPTSPETGYGYIQINGNKEDIILNESFRKVKLFTEKPDHDLAQKFVESDDFFWNSGKILFAIWIYNSLNR